MQRFLDELRRFDALRDGEAGNDIVSQATLGAIAPTYADSTVLDSLSPVLATALHGRNVHQLYQHQAEAIRQARNGNNVVLQAPTASGKTLAFQVPMLETLATKSSSHALMIYPTKALALDQRDQLMRLADKIPGRLIESWWYDGDTDQKTRAVLRPAPTSDPDNESRDAPFEFSRSC